MRKLLKKHDMNHYSVMKALVVERIIICWRTTCGNSLRSMETINELIHYRVSYQSTEYRYAWKHRIIGIWSTPAIINKFLTTVYNRIKIAAPARFKVDDSVHVSKFKTLFKKDTHQIGLRIIKVQKTNPVIYLLKHSCRKLGGFYEYKLHRVTSSNMYLVKKVSQKGKWGEMKGNEKVCEMAGIWQFTQFMDTQGWYIVK